MRRVVAVLAGSMLAMIAAAGPAAANVQRLTIRDPGWVNSSACSAGPTCTASSLATVEISIKCPVGEVFTLILTVKQDGGDTQGTTQEGGECTGSGLQRYVNVVPDSGAFHPGSAKVKASALSNQGAGAGAGVFDVNVDRKITLVAGGPPCC